MQTGIDPTDQRFSQLQDWFAVQDFSSYPLPHWHRLRSTISSDSQDAAATLVFSDDAKTSGIQFLYEDAAIAGSDTTRLFEFTGGGVAALDADLDGWPDVFLTQGVNAPALGNLTHSRVSASQASPADQLFRNLRGQTFRTVTESAKLIDGGENLIAEQDRLFAGDGEGGFADITESVGIRAKDGLGLGLVALLATNRTTDTGHYLALRLTGVQSPRHPVGAEIRVTTVNGDLDSQLTAGDGYQACNENSLLFGLGRQTQPVTVTIKWSSGCEQTLPSIPIDSWQTIVEGTTSFSLRQ